MPLTPSRRTLLRGTLGATGASLLGCRTERARELGHASAPPEPGTLIPIRVQVNAQPRSAEVDPDTSALELVREQLGLRGSKLACGHGVCGACTMLVDGAPVAACLLPATSLHGRTLTTVEGLTGAGGLHPVQRAFMAEDALQCGYCTAGFVVEASAFYERWRAGHGDAEPERDAVAAALSGHLCRCGAYENILQAVQHACRGDYEREVAAPPRHEARDKVQGAAQYTVDVQLPDQLEARIVRSPHAHAKVRRVDWSQALALPGVAGAVDLMSGATTIRFAGQEIAAVAASDARTAAAALGRIVVEYALLPAALDMAAAQAPGAPVVYPTMSERRHPVSHGEGPLLPERWHGNLRGPFTMFSHHAPKLRRVLKTMCADRLQGTLIEGDFTTQTQCHTCLEPHACVAHWQGEQLTVYLSTQAVHQAAEDIASRWKLKDEQVQVIAQHVGGGFGGKASLTPEVIAAIELTRLTGKPVRVALDRREELTVGGARPAHATSLALAADPTGALIGVSARSYADGGAAVGSTSSLLLRIMYADSAKDLADYDVLTNTPPSKPFRAPGGPPAFWALEQAVDEAAAKLHVDPVALRRRWDPNPARRLLYDWAERLPAWKDRPPPQHDRGRLRRGVGVAAGGWMYFVQPSARVQLAGGPDGFVVSTACQDIGNGTRTVLARAIGGALGVAPSRVEVRIGDSRLVQGPMSGGSRTTASLVPAAQDASAQMRAYLIEQAERLFGARGTAVQGGVKHPGGLLTWGEILTKAPPASFVGARRRDRGGWFIPPIIGGLAVGKYIAGALHVFEVEVDSRLGRVRVLRTFNGVAAGRIVAPALARSQVLGAVTRGIRYALDEERRVDPRSGLLLTGGLEDYRIAGISDIGASEVHFVEEGFDNAGAGGVGLAELAALAPAAAIANAIVDATGFRPRDLPIRLERVLAGVPA